MEPLTTSKIGNNVRGVENNPQETSIVDERDVLYEYQNITDINSLPARQSELNWHIAGFVDGDGSFPIVLSPVSGKKFGWLIQPRFQIQLRNNRDSYVLLQLILRSMKVQVPILQGQDYCKIIVTNRRVLSEKVVPFFRRYGLVLKHDELELLAKVIRALDEKAHLTDGGFTTLVREIFSLPTDGEDRRKWNFQRIVPDEPLPTKRAISKLEFPGESVALRHYFSGFIDAEGALGYAVLPASRTITPYLTVTHQNTVILKRLQQVLQSGQTSTGRLQIYGLENIASKIIPFLDRHQLIAKSTAYQKFKEIFALVSSKKHKTSYEHVMTLVRSQNDRGILRDHTLSTYSEGTVPMKSEDMVQLRDETEVA